MPEHTLKYRLMKQAAKTKGLKKNLSRTAAELREKYRPAAYTIGFPDRARSHSLEFERRFEHGSITGRLTHKRAVKAVLFIPGGGMLKFPDVSEYKQFEEIALKTDRDVVIPYYPLCVDHPMNEAVEMIYDVYRQMTLEYGAGNVAVAGYSSGGTLALALISHINAMAENVPMPDKLYVSSPMMCIHSRQEREHAERLDKSDFIVPVKWLDTFREIITNGRTLPDYMAYPQLGDYSGLTNAYVCFADSEVLYAMCGSLVSQMESAGTDVTLEVGRGMYHCYPVTNKVSEAYLGHFNMMDYLRVSAFELVECIKQRFGGE